MSRSNLIIARVGQTSLHPAWLAGAQYRNWDLCLCPYQPLASQDAFDLRLSEVIPGPKWTGLRELLAQWNGWQEYERIWLPDDDIFASAQTIDRMFEVAARLDLDLCGPALHESSYYAHFDTMRNTRCVARRCGFVEIMAPCFSVDALRKLLPTLELTPTGWGWGLDSLWPKLLDYRNIGMIDTAPVLHTRPVGMFRDAELARKVRAESDHIMATYDCVQVHTTFEAIGPDLASHDLSAEALAALLADGWQYLWRNEPMVLAWLLAAQQPPDGWSDYPIAGRPSCAAS
jgi:hypothetical protein